ncbi:hypothetical protein F4813DRAFT_364762 [Daldinia decipiens]|uniref:uncharacterized protein n=1 Tax=Daldinia decipiens TaxID=326647 RepID=UPI0020C1C5AF|nr:uncharacterized protein F4813DRAFT_364762 [Daldinia decipiens]KAI1656238.1 hypothetical protein F4813DRAFT_364762 [Daldinia decipiens]
MSLASPTSKDGFSYAGDLFAEASGHNRHRRATVAELKDHFKSGSEKDHPAHWFEAQLIHYGLQVSKTKAVARMRLFDAVNAGNLSIPAHIQKLESELKKEWIKKEREAKKAFKDAASSPAPKATGAKRKAESSNVDVTVSVGGINVTVSASNSNKKAKTPTKSAATAAPSKAAKKTETKPKAPKAPKAAATPKAASATTTSKTTASKTTVSKTTVSKTTTTKTTAAKPPLAGRMARRGGVYQSLSRESSAATSIASTPQPARPPQFAFRGRGQATRGRGGTSNSPSPVKREHSDDDDDDDVKYEDSDDGYGHPSSSYRNSADLYDNDDEDLKPLGLLNGRYVLTSDFVTSEWGHRNFSLVFTLSGTELWGRFDLGIVSGVMRLPQRPWQSSTESLRFTWRGQELEGPMMYGDSNHGSMRFLGGGKVEGELDWMGITFEGNRVVGQGTRSEVDISRMRTEWEGYNEDEYERENRSRW